MKKSEKITVVHYWGGNPKLRTSRFDWHHAILDGCRRRRWRSIIVFSKTPQNEEIKKALSESDIESFYISRPRRQFDLRCIYESYRLFRKVKCTIAHFHCVHTSPIIGAALAGVPIRIWSSHSSEYKDDGRTLGRLHRFGVSTRVTCALAHKILPVSDSVRREFDKYRVPENRISMAPVPIDIKRYTSRPEAKSLIRKSLGFSDSELLISTVGQAIYRKGWDILVHAFIKSFSQNQQVHLLLTGSMTSNDSGGQDSFQNSLLQLADEPTVKGRIHFLGVRHDVAGILSASDIFVFPSRSEALGLALLEAMAAGLPCIASTVGGIPEIIQDGQNGLLVPGENIEALAALLTRLADDKSLRTRLGDSALSSLKVFSLDYQAKNILNIYDDMLAKQGL